MRPLNGACSICDVDSSIELLLKRTDPDSDSGQTEGKMPNYLVNNTLTLDSRVSCCESKHSVTERSDVVLIRIFVKLMPISVSSPVSDGMYRVDPYSEAITEFPIQKHIHDKRRQMPLGGDRRMGIPGTQVAAGYLTKWCFSLQNDYECLARHTR